MRINHYQLGIDGEFVLGRLGRTAKIPCKIPCYQE